MFTRNTVRLALLMMACLLPAALLPASAQSPTVTTLYTFSSAASGTNTDGAYPRGGLIQASDGYLYGTATNGGAHGTGTLFKLSLAGVFATLYSFTGRDSNLNNADGAYPYAAMLEGTDHNFYGTAEVGGVNGAGTAFQFTPAGVFTTLHSFSNTGSDGAKPFASLIEGSDGNFYGTTSTKGNGDSGTVFKLTSAGVLTTIHTFTSTGTNDGANPFAPLFLANDGNFYDTTSLGGSQNYGAIIKVTTGGAVTLLHSFDSTDGEFPKAGLVQGSDGNLYGVAFQGGAGGIGSIFKITTTGTFTLLHSFANTDGAYPNAILEGADGAFYGTTYGGGANKVGTLFKIASDGTFTSLYTFNTTDGAYPRAGLVQASDGNFYGTTYSGGTNNDGTIFCLNLNNVPVPVLTSISPASANAGGPAFTLIAKGSSFVNTSVVDWTAGNTTTPLTTTYVSATQVKAAVPASLIASAGKATITVVTPGSGASTAKTFTILLTTLKLASATLTKNSTTGVYTANLSLKNTGYQTAPSVSITRATLNKVGTTSTLPVSVGSIAAGATGGASLTFPASAGTSGSVVILTVSGTFTGGKFSGSLKVTLP